MSRLLALCFVLFPIVGQGAQVDTYRLDSTRSYIVTPDTIELVEAAAESVLLPDGRYSVPGLPKYSWVPGQRIPLSGAVTVLRGVRYATSVDVLMGLDLPPEVASAVPNFSLQALAEAAASALDPPVPFTLPEGAICACSYDFWPSRFDLEVAASEAVFSLAFRDMGHFGTGSVTTIIPFVEWVGEPLGREPDYALQVHLSGVREVPLPGAFVLMGSAVLTVLRHRARVRPGTMRALGRTPAHGAGSLRAPLHPGAPSAC